LLFYIFKNAIRLSVAFFYRRVTYVNRKGLGMRGPLMIAANHPNSFLDAIYFAARNNQPVHVITRGDVFEKPAIGKLLRSFRLIPIYRIRDGKEKMGNNDATAEAVIEVLRKGGIVMIFVEGFCIHQTELVLPLKKGSPRMVTECWNRGIDVKVLPLWLRYDSFKDFGKIMDANFGEAFGKEIISENANEAAQVMQINKRTEDDLLRLSAVKSEYHPLPSWLRNALWPFAMLSKMLHYPLYKPLQSFVAKKTTGTVFYDSIMLAVLTFTYPVYLLLIACILLLIFHSHFAWLVFAVFPFLARVYLFWKK